MAKSDEFVHVEFLKYWQSHVPKDVASFSPEMAKKLVEAKIAVPAKIELKAAAGAQVTK